MLSQEESIRRIKDAELTVDKLRILSNTIASMIELRNYAITHDLEWWEVKRKFTGSICLLCSNYQSSLLASKQPRQEAWVACNLCAWQLLEGEVCKSYDNHEEALERYERWQIALNNIINELYRGDL
jgi:hypothetical protein